MRDPEARPPKTQRSQRSAEAAARTYLRAHLGWLRGVPAAAAARGAAGLPWATFPRAGGAERPVILTVDRERIRQTEYGRNAARRRFPVALSAIVGDVEAWTGRTDSQLAILKRIVHDGAAMPDLAGLAAAARVRRSTARRLAVLARERPSLAGVASGLVWLHWHDEADLLRALDALEGCELTLLLDRLGEDAVVVALRLVELAADGSGAALVRLLGDRRAWEVPCETGDVDRSIAAALAGLRTRDIVDTGFVRVGAAPPPPRLGSDIARSLADFWAFDAAQRARQSQLLDFLLRPELLASWEAWWVRATALQREARALLAVVGDEVRSEALSRCQELESRLARELRSPPAVAWPQTSRLARSAAAASPAVGEALVACLGQLVLAGGGQAEVGQLLERWSPVLGLRNRSATLLRLVTGQHRLLAGWQRSEHRQLQWLAGPLASELIDTWIYEARPTRLIEPALASLARLLAGPGWRDRAQPFPDYAGWSTLVAATAATGDAEIVAGAMAAVEPTAEGPNGEMWLALLRLSGGDLHQFARLAEGWRGRLWGDELVPEVVRLAKDPRLAAILHDGVSLGEGRRLARLVALSRLAGLLGLPVALQIEAAPAATAAFVAYPDELQPLLGQLAAWDPKAVQSAGRVLGRDFPTAAGIEAELATLRRLAADADGPRARSLATRIANLEARLASPRHASPRRLANHRAKLERRLAQARLDRWEAALTGALQAGLADALGVAPPIDWVARPDVARVLAALTRLDARFRSLAFRLIGRSFGPEPWDLREEPANRDFLARLERQGVRIAPWLEGLGPVSIDVAGRALVLDLERHPLEIMRMGAPFETCLAPDGFNFFSTVANAADINKRVLYARDAAGAIQARCLLALTGDGHIVTFHVYAHAPHDDLTAGVRDYVRSLATAMGTSVAARGEIPLLVAPAWYDDGPRDLTGQLAFLDEGSLFVGSLAALPQDAVATRLAEELNGAPITPSIVCQLARLEPVSTRPELILPLLPHLGDLARLDPWSRLLLLPLVRRAGDLPTARELMRPLERVALRAARDNPWLPVETARELLALGEPHRALGLIRRTRPQWVKDWPEEWEVRTHLAAQALCALHRPHRALQLARHAVARGSSEAVALVAGLERDLGLSPSRDRAVG